MKKIINSSKARRPSQIYKQISQIGNLKKRNLLRGLSSKSEIGSTDARSIREPTSSRDSQIAGAILKGPWGLLTSARSEKKTSGDLYLMTRFPPLDWKNELAYTTGYLNSVNGKAIECLNHIRSLTDLENLESEVALNNLLDIAKKYGASNFISYKLAYLRSARDLQPAQLRTVHLIEEQFRHRDHAGLHFSALENVSSKLSLFTVAQRRVSGLVARVDGEFRKAISLSNFVPTPVSEADVPGFLLRASESCLIDTVHSILVLFNLPESFGNIVKELERLLNEEIVIELKDLQKFSASLNVGQIITDYYRNQNQDSYPTLDIYRASAAFLDRPQFAKYRNRIDKVIGVRLLAEILNESFSPKEFYSDSSVLLAPDGTDLPGVIPIKLDAFYRTFELLRFIEHRPNLLSLSKTHIQFVFENTIGLEMLLSEKEMRDLYITAPLQTRGLAAVLALALFRQKSIDPDVDFEFRSDFVSYVKEHHAGSILQFVEHLLSDSPQVANYLVGSLDEVTLEKMYTLVKNSSQASQVRCDILRAVGQKLNRIEYFIEADAITTRSKLSKLQQYFDSSRMYVDSISMKKWLDTNPTISTEQYRSLYPRISTQISSVEDGNGAELDVLILRVDDQNEYLVSQIAKDAFEQFCLNNEFGIQSYLGRRIRHNTLDGVTTDTVDAVLRKAEYRVVLSNPSMQKTVEGWMAAYKSVIDRLRRENLQFKSSASLFKSTLDLTDPATAENIRKLSGNLRSAGGSQLLNDLVIAFCWKQITPQLENAARFIRTSLLREANSSIDKYFSGYYGAIEGQIKSELQEAVNEVFKKVADWFQVPETGFISASVRDICQIILIELNRQTPTEFIGEAVDIKYTGISVHRLYDCLAVLLQNAHKHGVESSPICVTVAAARASPDSVLDLVSVDIASTVAAEKYEISKMQIAKATEARETGADMVNEGYTGIKKIKFITRASEGIHTMRCTSDDAQLQLKLGFSIHAEIVTDEPRLNSEP